MPRFVPGLDLARAFYEDVIRDIVGEVEHSAALLGSGSDVLDFDTERSTDHGWGPRIQLFVAGQEQAAELAPRIDAGLPEEFRGWPTRYGWDDVPVGHHIHLGPLGPWLEEKLGFDPRNRMNARDWLTTPQQLLLEVTGGAVFHDGLCELERLRRALEWYPHDVWLWLLACQWRRIDQEEPFVGRTAEVGDELGSRVLAARLARDLMRLCFLFERRYAPYSKWFGSAFAQLDAAADVGPPLEAAIAATDGASREDVLVEAMQRVGERHNDLGLTERAQPTVRPFHGRPFRVLGSGRFVDACAARISDPWLRSLPLVGSIDQLSDSTDVLSNPAVARRAAALYDV